MKEWYQGWSDIMKAQGGKLTESQIAQMQSEQRGWYQKAEDLRDNVFTITGYDEVAESSQSSTTGSYDGITQDQGNEISGRLTAVQWVQQTISQNTTSLVTLQTANNSFLSEVKNLTLASNGYLADIAKYNKQMYNEWTDKLDKMQKSLEKL